jgi:hypothetical protein
MTDKPILPEAQKFSDMLMMTRAAAAELKHCSLITNNALLALVDKLMDDPAKEFFAMYGGEIEAGLMELAAAHGKIKALHIKAQEYGRKFGIAMPATPTYSDEYKALAGLQVPVTISGKVLRR